MGTLTIGFLLLTAFVFFFPSSLIDREFSEEVQEHHNLILDTIMKAISWFGYLPNAPITVTSIALIFFYFKYKKEALFLLSTLLSGVVSSIIKLLINRPRPSEPLVRIIVRTQQQSFPSGHVLFYVLFFGFLTFLMYEIKTIPKFIKVTVSVISLLFIFTIPYSRVYLGAHWFTDVAAGFLLGLICLYVLSVLYLKKLSIKK
ncbi:phosphatase PAP2 family protein [Mucilaginibacter sp. SP1R1]|uniref:phosphatase PAP2 family protein n=1 Tax=Mucilaginibacter sp. SP1R1 TaxID=2723091 RepID=UPI00161F7396|nr:phosphatase PAP2 family protein [Mucilaginibacter sp. SP1R1]MBB6152674.1 undecaprenyl-diphosphatase [Mucilaginibacter sp. SP1R1]